MQRYTILLAPDLETGGYVVTVPALEGCVTEGDTLEEAIANAREAIQGYVASMIAHGQPIPHEPIPPQVVTIDIDIPAPVPG